MLIFFMKGFTGAPRLQILKHALTTLKPYEKAKYIPDPTALRLPRFLSLTQKSGETCIPTAVTLRLSCVQDLWTHCSQCQSREGSNSRLETY